MATQNEMELLFGQGLSEETGDLVPLPAMPLLSPAPGPDEPSVAEEVDRGRVRQRATGEVHAVDRDLDEIRIGDEVELPDGRSGVVVWIDPKRRRIQARIGRSKLFYSLQEVERVNGARVAASISRARAAQAAEEGRSAPEPTRMPSTIGVPEGLKLFPHQLENVEFIEREGRGLIADEMGLGKAQPLDARILTPDGWVRMGDVCVGDVVVDPDTGDGARVTGIFERGERDCYRVTMSDGSSTECCDEHLWTVQTPTDKCRGNRWRTMPLSEFMGSLHQHNSRGDRRRKWFVPLTQPVVGERVDLPIDPYLLGLLLGDGTMPGVQSSGVLGSPCLSTADEAIVRMAQDALPPGLSLKKVDDAYDYRITRDSMKTPVNELSQALAELGLASCSSPEKFVPDIYLRATAGDRMSLLQGLCDTDGSWTGSAVEFSTTSPFLRDAVVELAYSLGGFCSVYEKAEPSYTYKGQRRTGRPAWRVYLRVPANPFRLARKASAWRPTNLARGFESVEYVGKKQMRCIAVDSQRNLYVTDGYIVTHNTISALVCIRKPAVVVCPALLKVNWAREIAKWLPDLTVAAISGISEPGPEEKEADVVVVNYDILHSHVEWMSRRGNKTVVADEAHYLKNLSIRWNKSQRRHEPGKGSPRRAEAFYELQQGVQRLIFLTGTPILNRAKEIFPLLHMLNPKEWGFGHKFCIRYCAGHYEFLGRRRIFSCDGRSNMDELHARISGKYMVRHTKEAELKNLPAKTRGSMTVSLSKHYSRTYRKARNDFLTWLMENTGDEEAVGRALQAEALVKLNKLRSISAAGKAEAAVQYIVDHFESTGRPLVVMGVHRDAFRLIREGLDSVNEAVRKAKSKGKMPPIARQIRHGMVVGGQSATARQEAIDAFQNEGTLDVLLYSIPIATGTTLTRASEVLFIERMWRPADQLQAEDRVHRIGQEQKVSITYLDAEGTIDLKLAQLLMEKAETAAAVIDGNDLTQDESAALVLGEMVEGGGGFFESIRELVENRGSEEDASDIDIGPLGPAPQVFDDHGDYVDAAGPEPELAPNPRDIYQRMVDEGFILDSWGDPL